MADESDSSPVEDLTLEPEPSSTSGRQRSRALWAVLAVIAVVTGAVVVTSGGGSTPPRLPVALGSAGGREAGTGSIAADMMLARVTYIAGKGLPALGGEAPAYRIEGPVDAARVSTLARALGLPGEPVKGDGLWRVTSSDAILEVAADGAGAWWYSVQGGVVSSGGGSSSTGCDPAATTCASTGTGTVAPASTIPGDKCTDECSSEPAPHECAAGADCAAPGCPPDAGCAEPPMPEPTPPADLPSKDAARKQALELLATTGLDVANAEVTVDGPYDAWYVTVQPRVDGTIASGWQASVAIGSKGAVLSASGTLGTPARLGDYPLIDTRAAIDRLNDQQGGYYGGPVPMGAPDGVARDLPAVTDESPMPGTSDGCAPQPDGSELCQSTGTAVAPPVCGAPVPQIAPVPAPDGSVTTLAPDPGCPEPGPYEPPVPIEVVLTSAEEILAVQYAIDGSNEAYLVPAYRFSSAEGNNPEVVAVADDRLAPTTTTPSTSNPPETPRELAPGETAEIGVGYYVDVNTHCGTIVFADRWWATDEPTPLQWSTPTEGGTFTLKSPDEGVFVGDAEGTKTAAFAAKGPAAELPPCA